MTLLFTSNKDIFSRRYIYFSFFRMIFYEVELINSVSLTLVFIFVAFLHDNFKEFVFRVDLIFDNLIKF